MKLDTIKVVADNEQGYIIINQSDLTEEHQIFGLEMSSEVVEIADMKKPQLLKYMEKHNIELPDGISTVPDIKTFLSGLTINEAE